MHSTYSGSRIFNDHDGWYVYMRQSDKEHLSSSKYKQVGDQHMVGPFSSKQQVENWLEGYLAMYAKSRKQERFVPDRIDTHH